QVLRADVVARKQAEAQAAKEQVMAKYQAARQAAVAAAAARHAEAMEKAKAAAAVRQAEALEKAKAASAARQAEALEKSKAAHAAKQAEIAAKTKAILAEKQAAEKAQHTENDVAHHHQTNGKAAHSATVVTVAHKHEDNQAGDNKETARHNTSKSNEAHTARQAEHQANHQDEIKEGEVSNYTVHQSKEFGRYIDVNDFGADPTGKKDSLAAIKAALTAAHKEKAMLFMDGTYYISDQTVINGNNSGVKGIFGSGMGKTLITFDKAQVGVFNPNTNHDDIRAFAGILVDGQSHKTIANLSVKYTNPDFYRKGLSYFGKVSGILVNDADHTLISKVEVSGVNRAGVMFTSTDALVREAGKSQTYKARVQSGEINEQYDHLPLGENNRIVDSYLHHNRVAGAMVGYQKNFVGEGNRLEWNGHEADGGTGYGMTAMAGSYNYGITFRNNT
ncbi:TPA: right-handed parallel beta-helix repeat-containing protein, partial [Enterococcus faecium]|nr:right-handed parallel beta-helix repeat-containing protein [Enterococcus faecium]